MRAYETDGSLRMPRDVEIDLVYRALETEAAGRVLGTHAASRILAW